MRTAVAHTWFMVGRQAGNLMREPIWIVLLLVQPMIWLLLYGQLFKRVTHLPGGGFGTTSYITFLAPAIVIMNAFFGATWSGMAMVSDLDRGLVSHHRQPSQAVLVDPANTGLGHRQVQRWNLPEGWVISKHPAHAALVSEADFIAAQDATAPRGPAGPATRRYLLAGLQACGTCGRRLESAWSNGKPAYRCRHGHTTAKRPNRGQNSGREKSASAHQSSRTNAGRNHDSSAGGQEPTAFRHGQHGYFGEAFGRFLFVCQWRLDQTHANSPGIFPLGQLQSVNRKK